MLLKLKIQNLILIESAEVEFGSGLNIITGETGAGKSALLSAIRLITGQRAEGSLVGTRGDLAIVEASLTDFWIPDDLEPPLKGMPLIIRREIHITGKSRAFAGDQMITLGLLKEIIGNSLEIVDQSSSLKLSSTDFQRDLLDSFSGADALKIEFSKNFKVQNTLEKELSSLLEEKEKRDSNLEWAESSLLSIDEVPWQNEEKILEELGLLSHSQELILKLSEIETALVEGSHPILSLLKRFSSQLEGLAKIDPILAPIVALFKNGSLELEEAASSLRSYGDRVDGNPQRLDDLEIQIDRIEKLKKRFGKTKEEILAKKGSLQMEIEKLTHLGEKEVELEKDISQKKAVSSDLSKKLSALRRLGAKKLSASVTQELKELNLPYATFQIEISEKPLALTGADEILFLFSANAGVAPATPDKCASGGELSRLLLALKIVLAEKDKCQTLIFDEIDSNVGGQTAAILGNKLLKLSQDKQLISVTHFVQVAKSATHHFVVNKREMETSAKTEIYKLNNTEKADEYQRMIGQITLTNQAGIK